MRTHNIPFNLKNIVKPRFRHHPFTLGLEFLGPHQRPIIDTCSFELEFLRRKGLTGYESMS